MARSAFLVIFLPIAMGYLWSQDAKSLYQQGVRKYQRSNIKGALSDWQEALEKAKKEKDQQLTGELFTNIASIYWQLKKYDKALKIFQQGAVFHQKTGNQQKQALSLSNIGTVYWRLGKHTKAIEHFQKAQTIYQKTNNKREQVKAIVNISSLYWKLKKFKKALQYFKEAHSIYLQMGAKRKAIDFLVNMAAAYEKLKNTDKTLEYLQQALTLCQKIYYKKKEASIITNIGEMYQESGKFTKAIELLKKALAIYQKLYNRKEQAQVLNKIGANFDNLRKSKEALKHFEQAYNLYRGTREKEGMVKVLTNIGQIHMNKNNHNKAIKYLNQALTTYNQMDNKRSGGEIFGNLGICYWRLKKYQKARQHFEQTLVLYRKLGQKNNEGAALINMGGLYSDMGEEERSIQCLKHALTIYQKAGNEHGQGTTLINLGCTYRQLGDYNKAFQCHKQALAIHQKAKDKRSEGMALRNMGINYQKLGKYDKALPYYEQELVIYREIHDRLREGKALEGLGGIYRNLNKFGNALKYYQQALNIYQKTEDKRSKASIMLGLGGAYGDLGHYGKALEYYQHSLDIYQKLKDQQGEADSFARFGIIYNDCGAYRKALQYHQQALRIYQSLGNKAGKEMQFNNIGALYADLGEDQKALSYYQQSLAIQKKLGTSGNIVKGNIGDIYLNQGKFSQALEMYKNLNESLYMGRYYLAQNNYKKAQNIFLQRLKKAKQEQGSTNLSASYIGLATAYEKLGEYPKATRYYRKACKHLEKVRSSLPIDKRYHFFNGKDFDFSRKSVYENLIHVLQLRGKQQRELLHYAEARRSRTPLEIMAKRYGTPDTRIPAEMEEKEREVIHTTATKTQLTFLNKLRVQYPEYMAVKYPKPIYVEHIRLQQGEVILEYEVLQQYTLLFVIKRDIHGENSISQYKIAQSRKELATLTNQFRSSLKKVKDKTDLVYTLAKQLYNLLLKPAIENNAIVARKTKLILIPDEILWALPFEALVAGGKYIGDLYHVTYAQSASALTMHRVLLHKDTPPDKSILMAAEPKCGDLKKRFSKSQKRQTSRWRLQSTGSSSFVRITKEYAKICNLRKQIVGEQNGNAFSGHSATESRLRYANLSRYRHLFFIIPGILDPITGSHEPMLLLTSPEAYRKQDGLFTIDEIMALQLRADVVLLTLYQHKSAKNIADQDRAKLGQIFQYAQAKSVLVNLWDVPQGIPTLFAQHLFQYLAQGKTTYEALQMARSALRKKYKHPYFWSSFILIEH